MTIEVEVSKLHIEKGDILTLTVDPVDIGKENDLFFEQVESLEKKLKRELGFDVPIIILSGTTLKSVSKIKL